MKETVRKDVINENTTVSPRQFSVVSQGCPACGAESRRETAKFCLICGHDLRQDYAPLDSLRASYNLPKQIENRHVSPSILSKKQTLFAETHNSDASSAMAFVVYSLVPYLGILFCPGALVLGCIGLSVSYHKPQLGGRQTAGYSLLLGSIILAVQILLWWLLYIIPELKR